MKQVSWLAAAVLGLGISSCMPPVQSSDKGILAFNFTSLSAQGRIDEAQSLIRITVPDATDRSSLTPDIQIRGTRVSPGSGVPQNFNSPVNYTVTAEDGGQKTYQALVYFQAQSVKNLTAFSLMAGSYPVVVQLSDAQGKARLLVPQGLDLANAVASFTTNAASVRVGSVVQVSGITSNDFSPGLTYTLTAQDGTTRSFLIETQRADFCNDVGAAGEVDSAVTQFPSTITGTPGQSSGFIYGRVTVAGVTNLSGAPTGIQAQLGYQPTSDHYLDKTWVWSASSWSSQQASADEYAGSFTLPSMKGTYRYAFRFSKDGGVTWTLSDTDGAGAGAPTLSEAKLGLLTVN